MQEGFTGFSKGEAGSVVTHMGEEKGTSCQDFGSSSFQGTNLAFAVTPPLDMNFVGVLKDLNHRELSETQAMNNVQGSPKGRKMARISSVVPAC